MSLPTEVPHPVNGPDTEPATAGQLVHVQREMNGFERSTVILAAIALIISILAAIFVCLQWWEMHTGAADTHALAVAAGKQADAAKAQTEKMAETLTKTDALIGQATDQAKATNRLAREAKRSADLAAKSLARSQAAMQIDQRPWLGMVDWLCDCIQTAESVTIRGCRIGSRNSGKTPAIKITGNWLYVRRPAPLWGGGEVPDYEREHARQIRALSKLHEPGQPSGTFPNGITVAPNVRMESEAGGGITWRRGPNDDPSKWTAIYLLGKIAYFDTLTSKEHTTGVCLVNKLGPVGALSVPTTGDGFSLCPTGNWMD